MVHAHGKTIFYILIVLLVGSCIAAYISLVIGQATYNNIAYTIEEPLYPNPIPAMKSMSVASAAQGTAKVELTIVGNNFVQYGKTQVTFGDSFLLTTYVSPTQLTAIIPSEDLLKIGTFKIAVQNDAPGGGTSNKAEFEVVAPRTPFITLKSISPDSTSVQLISSTPLVVTVKGIDFTRGAVVKLREDADVFNANGYQETRYTYVDLKTTYLSSTQLTAVIPADQLRSVKEARIMVVNPSGDVSLINPNGAMSGDLPLIITSAPAPSLSAIIPSSALFDDLGRETITIYGKNFIVVKNGDGTYNSLSIPRLGPYNLDVIKGSTTFLVAKIPAKVLESLEATTYDVRVYNGISGGGASHSVPFRVFAKPIITSMVPHSVERGSSDVFVTINGMNFAKGATLKTYSSSVFADGIKTVYISPNKLKATIPQLYLTTSGVVEFFVNNGASRGGGSSNLIQFTISGTNPIPTITSLAPATVDFTVKASEIYDNGLEVTITGTNFLSIALVKVGDDSYRVPTYVSPTGLKFTLFYDDLVNNNKVNIVVRNPEPGGGDSKAVSFEITASEPPPAPPPPVEAPPPEA